MSRRVLIVITTAQRRGAEIEGFELSQRLQALGWQTRIVALTASAASTCKDELPVEAIGDRPLGIRTLRRLRTAIRAVDVVVAYGSTTLPACSLATLWTRVPFIYRSIGDPAAWSRGRLHRARTGVVFRRARRIVALWPGAAKSITMLYGVDPARLSVISNARDPHHFRLPTEAEHQQARSAIGADRSPILAVVGSLSPEKRIDLVIDAVASMDEALLVVVGDGELRDDLVGQAALKLGNRCTFVGSLDDVRPVLWGADLLLLTSATEGLPGILLEALMSGLGCIATDVGGIRELLGDHPMVDLVPVDIDCLSLASTIADQLGRTAHPTPHSIDAVAGVERFSWDVVAAEWSGLLAGTLRGG